MKKKEFIEKVKNLILNKVRFHAPNLVTENVDFDLLSVVGIDPKYPIFVFSKPLDNTFYTAFKKAKREAKFNLVLSKKPLVSVRKIEKLDLTKVLLEEELGNNLFYTLDGLNINYISHTSFEKKLKDNYLKIDEKEIEFDFCPYYFYKKVAINGIIFEGKEFLMNGKNYDLSFSNPHGDKREISIEFNMPLPRGYYVFKKGVNFIEILNLNTKERGYFNFQAKGVTFSFSSIDGLENSTFACINVRCKLSLNGRENKHIFFNFGQVKFLGLTPNELREYFEISQKKMFELFDVMVTSADKNFDKTFNLSLPRKIWENWEKMTSNENDENEWIKLKNKIIIKSEKGERINNNFSGLKEVKMFRNSGWKRVFIVHGDSDYLYDGKAKYFNFSLLTKEILSQNSEIYLSFKK